jgi:serine protease AprX
MRLQVTGRLSAAAVVTLAACAALGAAPVSASPPGPGSGAAEPVIVQYDSADAAAAAVLRAGGTVGRELAIAHAFAAVVPAGSLAALRAAPGVWAVTPDGAVALKGKDWIGDANDNVNYGVSSAVGIAQTIGASEVWKKLDPSGRTVTGAGIGVALIDSGITPVAGLTDGTRIVNGPDLSLESQTSSLRSRDTFGHGTHMAGIIAGQDASVKLSSIKPGEFVGIAPDATLINVKVAAADGSVDVSQVIAGIDWVVTHRNDPGLNIKVLNLSFGTDSLQDPKYDPLSSAVEAAWRKGIVVVVAAGNSGTTATRLGMPAMNPYVLAVGGADQAGSIVPVDDTVGTFSSRGSTARHADLVAPGASVVSLRDPGSYIDTKYPAGLVPASIDPTQRFFRGSGTSQAAAVVSGAAALLLQQRPNLTPDQVKRLLMSTSTLLAQGGDAVSQGTGEINVSRASDTAIPAYTQSWTAAAGTGSLEQSRGTAHITDPATGVQLTGERDIMGGTFTATTWSAASRAGTAWSGGTWNGRTWAGTGWGVATSWATRTWSAATWSGTAWDGQAWSGLLWSGAVWDGHTWSGGTWTGHTWSGHTWSGGYWSGSTWG